MTEGEVVLLALFLILFGTVVSFALADTPNDDDDRN